MVAALTASQTGGRLSKVYYGVVIAVYVPAKLVTMIAAIA